METPSSRCLSQVQQQRLDVIEELRREGQHGMTDVELRYRPRYVDLMSSPEVRQTFIKRSRIVQEVRKFMTTRPPSATLSCSRHCANGKTDHRL